MDHIQIAVRDYVVSRDWYVEHFGFELEFQTARARVAGLQDASGITLILVETKGKFGVDNPILALQVDDVEAKYRQLSSRGVAFVHPPKKKVWGYGAELLDPSGYRIRLWDRATMDAKG